MLQIYVSAASGNQAQRRRHCSAAAGPRLSQALLDKMLGGWSS